jgi:hypothetical protein
MYLSLSKPMYKTGWMNNFDMGEWEMSNSYFLRTHANELKVKLEGKDTTLDVYMGVKDGTANDATGLYIQKFAEKTFKGDTEKTK